MAGRKNILIVEDDFDAAEAMCLLLEAHGYSVSKASEGNEALQILKAGSDISLIVLDLFMPGMDGRTFLRTIRRDPHFQKIPVIVVSAWASSLTEAVDATFTKPLKVGLLLDTVDMILGGP